LSFFTVATENGTLEFKWIDEHCNTQTATAIVQIESSTANEE
jgi:hypothetical protein